MPLKENGERLIDFEGNKNQKEGKKYQKCEKVIASRFSVFWRWMVGSLLNGALLWLYITILAICDHPVTLYIIVLMIPIIFMAIVIGLQKGIKLRGINANYWVACAIGGLVQIMDILFVMMISSKFIGRNSAFEFEGLMALCTIGGALLLGFAQFCGAKVIDGIKTHARPLTASFQISVGIITLLAFIPFPSAVLAGSVLQASASGGRHCVTLTQSSGLVEVDDMKHGVTSKLRIMALMDGKYYVRPSGVETKNISFVNQSDIIELKECEPQ
ncbi:hypothetical protein FACS1894154_08190 [Betaproteobacteria bacterium]|nr:hypothetical protein FACS1894154_08190 [Betaproteobacteria bacterium]